MPFKKNTPEDFWKKVNKNGPVPAHVPHIGNCWIWMGSVTHGYGSFGIDRKHYRTHRYSYMLANGPFDQTLDVCHRCDNPSCVRPEHLFLGDDQANMVDAVSKGRLWQNKRTHCKNGHELSGHNLIIENRPHKGGISKTRLCRTCRNEWARQGTKRRKNGVYVSKLKEKCA